MKHPSYSYAGVPIHAVYSKREVYDDYPSCQRDFIWKLPMQQRLIDTILRGLPIPVIYTIPGSTELGGVRMWIVDGQQRLKTILRYRNDEFKTSRDLRDPGLPTLYPGKTFSRLPPEVREYFDMYEIQFCRLGDVDVSQTGLIYRRHNHQVSLKLAEHLYSYSSKGKEVAATLSSHPALPKLYPIPTTQADRKQHFQMGVHMLIMEIKGVFSNMTTPQLHDVVSGLKDGATGPEISSRISRTLSSIGHIFDGVTITNIHEIIPLYQAVLLLEEAGYNLARSESGCLTKWYYSVRADLKHDDDNRRHTASNGEPTLWGMGKVVTQRKFWAKHLPIIYAMPGLVKPDPRRFFDYNQKLEAWIRQDGRCGYCKRELRFVDAVGHHNISHANGGPTITDNCVVIHPSCHDQLNVTTPNLLS